MPEIAEVETIRRQLAPLQADSLADFELFDPLLAGLDLEPLRGRQVSSLLRHGKLLGIAFDNELTLALHLRMTGRITFGRDERVRLLLRFQGNGEVSFSDTRRFGTAVVVETETFGSGLGPDLFALADTASVLTRAERSRRPIKDFILDQTVVSGIGNYLADEALWATQIHPLSPVSTLPPQSVIAALTAARDCAMLALSEGGASFSDYRRTDGSEGSMQHHLRCYGRAGKPCERCQTTLVKIRVGGRGTTLCPSCQHLAGV